MKKKEKKEDKLSLGQVLSNFGYAFRMMLKLYPQKFFFTLFFWLFGGLINFFSYTYMLRYIVNGLQEGKKVSLLLGYVLFMMVINILMEAFRQIYDCLIGCIIDRKCSVRLMKTLYKKSIEMDISNYENPTAYDLYNRAISNGTGAINGAMYFVGNTLSMILDLSLSSWLVFMIDPVLFVFVLLPLLLNALNVKLEKVWYDFSKKEQAINRRKDYTRRSFYLGEFAKEMRLTNIHRVMLRRFAESIKDYLALVKKEGVKKSIMLFGIEFGTEVISILGAEMYAIYRTLVSGTIMYGDCLVVLNSIGSISYNIQSIGGMFTWIYDIALNIQDYRRFITAEPKVHPNPDGKLPSPGDIELKNVSFRYDGAEADTLKNVNMYIKQGEKIAIVGHNGAGKTTLVKLLMRLYDVSDGSIMTGGTDIREYRLKEYRSTYGAVFQDYRQMAFSVAENVLGRTYTPDDEELVIDSLKKAGVWERVTEQPEGIHTIMTREFDENGLLLSGGQSQKLAIASIYAGNASTVILDEPSSALDPLAEHEMYENMAKACEGKTMIFISHRLSSAVDADRIFLMEDGTVAESGNHSELMKKNGKYAEIFRMQAQNYTDNINEGGQDE